MEYLFNSTGKHIANLVGEQLHAPTGENIGHYLSDQGFFIDISRRYLGEIVHGNRLMFNRASQHRSTNFGAYGNYGETTEASEQLAAMTISRRNGCGDR